MGTEETKEQQQMYNIFRSCIYIFLIIELVMNLPITSESRVTQFILELIGRFQIFNSVQSCKLIELICIAVTCIGTRAKVSLKFNVKTMVIYPIVMGFSLIIACMVLHHGLWGGELCGFATNRVLYALSSIVGTMLVHQGLDGIARYYNHKLGEDRFNFENESFEQSEDLNANEYSVNIPMVYYFKRRMHKGWINIINPFRGRRRTNRAISVKLIYWLKLNVNNLKSAIWVKQRKITENIRKGMTSGWLGTSVGNYRFCFPEFPTNLRTPNGLNSIILSQFGMCK